MRSLSSELRGRLWIANTYWSVLKRMSSALSNTNRFSTAGKEKGIGLLKLWPPVGLGTEKPRVPEKAALPIIRQHQSW